MSTQLDPEIVKRLEVLNGRLKAKGRETAFIVSDDPDRIKVKTAATNVVPINTALNGGVALGSITILFGSEGVGKTGTGLSILANAWRQHGLIPVYICTEPPVPENTIRLVGLDHPDCPLIVKLAEGSGEEVLDWLMDLMVDRETGKNFGFRFAIMIDSINGLVSNKKLKAVAEKGSDANTIGTKSRMHTDFLEELATRGVLNNDSLLVMIAQLRTNISATYAFKDLGAGLAARFMPKVIIKMTKKKFVTATINGTETPIGHETHAEISKNNINGRPVWLEYVWSYDVPEIGQKAGVDDAAQIYNKALELGLLEKNGRKGMFIKIPGEDVLELSFTKKADVINHLRENTELLSKLRENL